MTKKTQQEKMDANPYAKTAYKYPLSVTNQVDNNGHYMMFNINVVSGSKFNTKSNHKIENDGPRVNRATSQSLRSKVDIERSMKRIDTAIILYMPQNITNTTSGQWDSTEIGSIGRIANTAASFSKGDLSGALNTGKEMAKSGLSSLAQQLTPLNAKDFSEFTRGTIVNPHMELLFRGMDARNFSFEFKFTPKSQEEAEQVRNIIKTFRMHMSPEYKYPADSSAYILYPSEFDISFWSHTKENDWMHKISTCALTNCSVNYTGAGTYSIFDNGCPTETTMTLEFTELELISKQMIEEGF